MLDIEWEITSLDSILAVGHASLDCVESVEHIALHHDELCNSVYHYSVAKCNEVDPSAAALSSCNGSIFVSEITQSASGLVEKLCRERTSSDTCTVSLHNAVNLSNLVGAYAES